MNFWRKSSDLEQGRARTWYWDTWIILQCSLYKDDRGEAERTCTGIMESLGCILSSLCKIEEHIKG